MFIRKILISIFFVSLLFTSPVHGKLPKAYGVGNLTCVWVLEIKDDSVASPLLDAYIQGYISGVNQMLKFENLRQIESTKDALYRLAMQKCRDNPKSYLAIALAEVAIEELVSKKK